MKHQVKNLKKKCVHLLSVLLVGFMLLSVFAQDSALIMTSSAVSVAYPGQTLSAAKSNTFPKKTYEELLKKLNKELKKKKFSEFTKEYLRTLLYYQVKNYNTWRIGYKDAPSLKSYITENLIDVIPSIKKIDLVDFNSKKGKKLYNDGYPAGSTASDDGDIIIFAFYNTKDLSHYSSDLETDLEVLAHEIRHAKDAILFDLQDDCVGFPNDGIREFFWEGAATFHQKFASSLGSDFHYYESIAKKNESCSLEYKKTDGAGYLTFLSFYESLVYLAGFEVVDSISDGNQFSAIKASIAKQYGSKMANRIIKTFSLLCESLDKRNGRENDETFRLAVKFQRLILECIKQDILSLDVNNPGEIQKYMDIYRNYKLRILPMVEKNDSYIDISNSFFKLDEIDDLFIQKIMSSNAVPRFFQSLKKNKAVVRFLLCAQRNIQLGIKDMDVLPPSIAFTTYNFYYEGSKLYAEVWYKDAYGYFVVTNFNLKFSS